MRIERIEEFRIHAEVKQAIRELFKLSFPDYPKDQIYFKQIPDFRYLCWQDQILVGHMAIEHRLISLDNKLAKIFGVVDLCVAPAFQRQHIASELLKELESLAMDNEIDFIVLLAKNHELYKNNGFETHNNICRWLIIHESQSFGIARRRVDNSLMVKVIGDRAQWQSGQVDFLGPIF